MPPLDIFLSTFAAVGGRGPQCPRLVFFSQYLLQQEEDWGCRDGPPCDFEHLFQRCTVLQETMQLGFQCSSKKLKNILKYFLCAEVLGLPFFTAGHRIRTHDLSCRKCRTKQCNTLGHCKYMLIFLVYSTSKVRKGKNFKTLRQNNAVVRRAALLERKQCRTS